MSELALELPAPPPEFQGTFRTDLPARAVYSETAGVGQLLPAAIAVPLDAIDVMVLVKWAAEHRVPLTARGAGSSMASGALGPGVIVDLQALDTFKAPDPRLRRIQVGPAVTRDRVQQGVFRSGLCFPVDPSSGPFCTIGGMVACNAAGARTVRYGATRHWVQGLDCIFADGTRAWVRRGAPAPAIPAIQRFLADVEPMLRAADRALLEHGGVTKESSGYALSEYLRTGELVDLLVGSEGTLAIFVDTELKLAPLPGATASLLAGFPDLEGAAAAATRIAAQGASAVELLDRSFLKIAASEGESLPLPPGIEAVLLVEAESWSENEARTLIKAISGWCEAGGAIHIEMAPTPADELRIWSLRHAASPILNRLAPKLQSMQLVEDGCVPPEKFARYVRGVRTALDRSGFGGVIFGHAGDAHAHVNALVDVSEPDWRERVEQLLAEVTALAISLGGTLAGEHGDGRLRTPLMARSWNAEARELFAATKRAFDPDGILNPGVKVALPGAKPLEAIKYDPSLPPLPPEARAALDAIAREKGWGRRRLVALAESAALLGVQ